MIYDDFDEDRNDDYCNECDQDMWHCECSDDEEVKDIYMSYNAFMNRTISDYENNKYKLMWANPVTAIIRADGYNNIVNFNPHAHDRATFQALVKVYGFKVV